MLSLGKIEKTFPFGLILMGHISVFQVNDSKSMNFFYNFNIFRISCVSESDLNFYYTIPNLVCKKVWIICNNSNVKKITSETSLFSEKSSANKKYTSYNNLFFQVMELWTWCSNQHYKPMSPKTKELPKRMIVRKKRMPNII